MGLRRAYHNNSRLPLHTDATDILAMLSIQASPAQGTSCFASGLSVFTEIRNTRPDLLEILAQGFHYYRLPETAGNWSGLTPRIPVFSFAGGVVSVCYVREYIELAYEHATIDASAEELEALDYFDEVAHSSRHKLDTLLTPGDLVLVNNLTILHGRTAFPGGAQRHLLRLWLHAPSVRSTTSILRSALGRRWIAASSDQQDNT